jgi:Flp pilus assembly protein TadD
LAVEKKYKSSGIAEAISYGKSLLATNGNEWDKADTELNGFGYQLLRIGAIEDAVRVFRWNTELHPDSWNVWDSLGEGLANAGDKAAAIAAYQKSIDLNSENKAGIEMVKKLKAN